MADRSAKKGAASEHCGWLYKRGGLNPAFKRRFFVLRQSTLAYYDADDSKTPKGELALLGATCEAVTGGSGDRERFELTVLEQGQQGRKFVLETIEGAARDSMGLRPREAWIAKLVLASTAQSDQRR